MCHEQGLHQVIRVKINSQIQHLANLLITDCFKNTGIEIQEPHTEYYQPHIYSPLVCTSVTHYATYSYSLIMATAIFREYKLYEQIWYS